MLAVYGLLSLCLVATLVTVVEPRTSIDLCTQSQGLCQCKGAIVTCVCNKDHAEFDVPLFGLPKTITAFHLSKCKEIKLYTNQFNNASNLNTIKIEQSGLVDIRKNAFSSANRLTEVTFRKSEMGNLEEGDFAGLRANNLVFDTVNIRFIKVNAFSGLNLRNNLLITNSTIEDIETSGIVSAVVTTQVKITKTTIRHIQENGIAPQTKDLVIEGCTISDIAENGINARTSSSSSTIKLTGNTIGVLDSGALNLAAQNRYLAVQNNVIYRLRRQSLTENRKYASVSGNRFLCTAVLCSYLTTDKFQKNPSQSVFSELAFTKSACLGPKFLPSGSNPSTVYKQFNGTDHCIDQFTQWQEKGCTRGGATTIPATKPTKASLININYL